MRNEQKLKDLGIEHNVLYYHGGAHGDDKTIMSTDNHGFNWTICLLIDLHGPTGKIYRGISLCNPKDQFNKKLGRAIALGRAIQAMEKLHSSSKMPAVPLYLDSCLKYLSTYDATLTEWEDYLVNRWLRGGA